MPNNKCIHNIFSPTENLDTSFPVSTLCHTRFLVKLGAWISGIFLDLCNNFIKIELYQEKFPLEILLKKENFK